MPGSSGARRVTFRDNRWGADFQPVAGTTGGPFTTSGNVSEPLAERPGICQPGADRQDDHGRGVAGVGNTDPKRFLTTWTVALLKRGSIYATKTPPKLWRTVLLRAIRLVVYPAKVRAPLERRHLRQRQSCVLLYLTAP